jgi:hypothetical protein
MPLPKRQQASSAHTRPADTLKTSNMTSNVLSNMRVTGDTKALLSDEKSTVLRSSPAPPTLIARSILPA